MKKLLCALLAMILVLSSMSALAAGVAPATGDSPIEASASVSLRTITVTFTETPFDEDDDVTFLFYKPESDTSDNIIDTNIIHADQIDYSATGFTFSVSTDVEAGNYNLLIGGTNVDVPSLNKLVLAEAVKYGDIDLDTDIDSTDLGTLAQYLAGFDAAVSAFEDASVRMAADVDHDTDVDSTDLGTLAQYLAGFSVDLGNE